MIIRHRRKHFQERRMLWAGIKKPLDSIFSLAIIQKAKLLAFTNPNICSFVSKMVP
jgi:hypothetical protein